MITRVSKWHLGYPYDTSEYHTQRVLFSVLAQPGPPPLCVCVCVCVCVFVNCPPLTALLMMSGELGDSDDLEVPSGHVISEAESTARINEGKDAAELKLLKEAQVRKQMIMTGR